MTEDKSPLELISQITELNDLSEFMKDEELDRIMELLLKVLFEKGRIPQKEISPLIVELQALAGVMALKSVFLMTIGKKGSEESMKKNVYFSAKELVNRLVDSMKYIARA